MRIWIPLIVSLFVLGPSLSSAQQVTGDLEGRILGEDGKPVAYANVVASGAQIQGTRSALSAADGYFRILVLPAGTYRVSITHVGYEGLIFDNVEVYLGRTSTLPETPLAVRVREAAKVVVVAPRPIIDPV